ncbi:MAG: hypothetical protein EPO65_05660 [Dehalococcoidia bacterium]|nr:MAG: hypothetical protein EPO65_05660 [Dehalococcoidia bacterium]
MRIQRAIGAALLAATLFATALGVASADNECGGKKKKGCEVPEVPYSAILPAATMAGITGFYFVQRRRSAPASVESNEAK